VARIKTTVAREYEAETGRTPEIFMTHAAQGTGLA
jgi:hypothetical protein